MNETYQKQNNELKYRKLIADIKKAFDNFDEDYVTNLISNSINSSTWVSRHSAAITFIHCREPNNIEKLKNKLNAKTLLIKRDIIEGKNFQNESDDNTHNYKYDFIFENNYQSLTDLKINAIDFFIKNIILE